MKALRHTRRLHRRHQTQARNATLNLVPMIDVFAILVFFLLSNASVVFARLHRLDLSLPKPAAVTAAQTEKPELRITVRADALQVNDRGGTRAQLSRTRAGHDLAGLSQLMQQLKQRYPGTRNAVILLEADVPYDDLIQVMDAVRIAPAPRSGTPGAELFPDIALGDAPVSTGQAP